jgi:hypothetical protein
MGGKIKMRFLALLKKELRECLPWLILALIIFAVFGTLLLQAQVHVAQARNRWSAAPGRQLYSYYLTFFGQTPTSYIGPLLFFTSIGMGLVLGARQFWMPTFSKTWAFTIHRSASRAMIPLIKFTAAIIAFVISCGLIWPLFYWSASRPGVFPIPPRQRILIEGWIFVILGLVMYFGAALSALSIARWYTTKLFGVVFAFGILLIVITRVNLVSCFMTIMIGIVILISQIMHIFLNREF